MSDSIKPTAEQLAVVAAAARGGNLKVKAYAGAGKTSTLQLVAASMAGRRGSYLAFNKEIAAHARRRFTANVSCRTVHSLAYASVDPALTARLNLPEEAAHQLAARYGIGALRVPTVIGRDVDVSAFEVGRMISDGLARFCRSAQAEPEGWHIPVDEKIQDEAAGWIRRTLLPYVRRHWRESTDPSGRSAIVPDVYLKVWAQSDPRIDADFILFDEAQDSDGVTLSVLDRQRHAQIIYVGDPYQQIYEWRGAVNAMLGIDAPECALTQSFRFGPTLAALASGILRLLGEHTPLSGRETIGSMMVEDPAIRPPVDALLCRKNVTAIWELAAGVAAGRRPGIRMSAAEIVAFADGADQLMAGRRTYKPAAFTLFETWKDAREYAESHAGRDMLPVVQLIDAYGSGYLRDLAGRIAPDDKAEYVISTVHRAKGLEWGRVRIANDFRFRGSDARVTLADDEMRLLYVAVTRARHLLDISELRGELALLLAPDRAAPGAAGRPR
jgi:hypothetical protein